MKTEINLNNNSADYLTATLKAAIGFVPFAGSVLAELASTIIPKQRADRIANFCQLLQEKIEHINQESLITKLSNENFTDLLEETTKQAINAVTKERREYLAELLGNGITDDAIGFIETKHILRILGEINDIEIIWLKHISWPYYDGNDDFYKKHKEILDPIAIHYGCSVEDLNKNALRENYLQHLKSLGLIKRNLKIDSKNKMPIFDSNTKDWKRDSHKTTQLGRLLLKHIGQGNHLQ